MTTRRICMAVIATVLLAAVAPTVVLAGTDSWTTTGPYGHPIISLIADPAGSGIMYAAVSGDGNGAVYKSVDAGETWMPITGAPVDPFVIVIGPTSSQELYVGARDGLYVSSDGGVSWHRILDTSQAVSGSPDLIRSVAVDPQDPRIIFAGGDFYLYRTLDGGSTWTKPEGERMLPMMHVVIDPHNSKRVYTGSLNGVRVSTDGGDTWNQTSMTTGVSSLIIRPDVSSVLYAGTRGNGLFVSDNAGATWVPVSGLGGVDVTDIAIDPLNAGRFYVASCPTGSGGGVYSSVNSGQTWTAMPGLSYCTFSVFVDARKPQSVFAGTVGTGVWKYTISGTSLDYSVSINGGALYTNNTSVTLNLTAPAGTSDMMISNDGGFAGADWERYATLKSWTITSLGSYVIPRTVYVRFRTNGQTSATYQDDIILDVTAPSGSVKVLGVGSSAAVLRPSAAYAQGLGYLVWLPVTARAAHPGMKTVELRLSASDDISGVDSVAVANEPTFAGAQWQSYAQSLPWWVSPAGSTTVYVRFRDRAGNVSATCSDVYNPG